MHRFLPGLMLLLLLTATSPVLARAPGVTFAPGAHLRFGHLTIDDGLSQNAGLALLQDRQGYLWFGTQDGLNRYDGYRFTTFKYDPADPASLSYNSVIALAEDAQGALWVGTWGGGLNRLDPQRGAFTRYQPDPANPDGLANPIVTAILPDGQGQLWLGTLGGLEHFDPATGVARHFRSDPNDSHSLSSDAISALLPTADGKIWVGTGAFNTPGAGLNLFDPVTGQAERLAATGQCLAGPNISDLLTDAQGHLWIAYGGFGVSGGGMDRFDPATRTCDHYDSASAFQDQITDNNITDLMLDRDGALWIASWSGGIWHMDADRPGAFTAIRHHPADPDSLTSDGVANLLQDRSGVLWIGMINAGIDKLNLANLQFRTYKHDPDNPDSIASNHVSTFAEAGDGTLWLGTWESGLSRFDPATGVFQNYRNDPANPQSISSDMVMALHADRDGTLWAGTFGSGLNRRDPASDQFIRYQHDPSDPASLLEDQVLAIMRDSSGRLWVSSFGGLSRLDPGARGFVNYPLEFPAVALKQIGDTLWVGTWGGGVARLALSDPASLSPQDAVFAKLRHDPTDPTSLSSNDVWSIHATADGLVWLGTQAGLNRYDPQRGAFRVYGEKDGLRNATILGILEDSAGWLWLTTNNGLAKFNPQSERFRIYDKNDGLQGNEFNSNGYLRSASGEIYVGGASGFSVFDPLALSQNDLPPQVVISSFAIFNLPQPFDAQSDQ
ncbi:MAG: hypothetical protein HGB28_04960, partial [Oscillochloris sp.]|nr:hypothetical protein [Oscillochloris sp.]